MLPKLKKRVTNHRSSDEDELFALADATNQKSVGHRYFTGSGSKHLLWTKDEYLVYWSHNPGDASLFGLAEVVELLKRIVRSRPKTVPESYNYIIMREREVIVRAVYYA